MDLRERVARRQRREEAAGLVVDARALSPAAHPEEPTDRGRVLERLLDALDPVFAGELPPDTYVHGPRGSGKTAVVRSLVEHLARHVAVAPDRIATTTRAGGAGTPAFVYVDGRRATSEFQLLRAVLESLVDEAVPGGGVRTDELGRRLADVLGRPGRTAVVAVDHCNEARTPDVADVQSLLGPVDDAVAWLCVGTTPPDELSAQPPRTVPVPAYERHALADVLSARASRGLDSGAITHERLRRIAAWADGDAHDALAALFGAATLAAADGADRVRSADVDAAAEAVHPEGVPVGLVRALPANRQAILGAFVDLDEQAAVGATARTIAARPDVDLSAGTVERFLYELADWGVLERVAVEDARSEQGRPPSRVLPRFPTVVFRQLHDLGTDGDR